MHFFNWIWTKKLNSSIKFTHFQYFKPQKSKSNQIKKTHTNQFNHFQPFSNAFRSTQLEQALQTVVPQTSNQHYCQAKWKICQIFEIFGEQFLLILISHLKFQILSRKFLTISRQHNVYALGLDHYYSRSFFYFSADSKFESQFVQRFNGPVKTFIDFLRPRQIIVNVCDDKYTTETIQGLIELYKCLNGKIFGLMWFFCFLRA